MKAKAQDVYELTLERHERRGMHRAATAVHALFAAMFGGFGTPSIGEFVVRRRADGAEVMRTDADADEATGHLRAHLEEQLAMLSPEEFLDAWSVSNE